MRADWSIQHAIRHVSPHCCLFSRIFSFATRSFSAVIVKWSNSVTCVGVVVVFMFVLYFVYIAHCKWQNKTIDDSNTPIFCCNLEPKTIFFFVFEKKETNTETSSRQIDKYKWNLAKMWTNARNIILLDEARNSKILNELGSSVSRLYFKKKCVGTKQRINVADERKKVITKCVDCVVCLKWFKTLIRVRSICVCCHPQVEWQEY